MLWMRHPPVGRSKKSMFIHVSPMKKSQCFTISRCLLLVQDGLSWNQIRSDTLLPGFSRVSRHLGPDILDCFNKIQCIHCFLVFHFSQMITLPVEVSQQVYRPWEVGECAALCCTWTCEISEHQRMKWIGLCAAQVLRWWSVRSLENLRRQGGRMSLREEGEASTLSTPKDHDGSRWI